MPGNAVNANKPQGQFMPWRWFRGGFGLPRSLSTRLVLGSVLVLVLALLIMGLMSQELVVRRLRTEMDGRLQMRAAELEAVTRIWKSSGQPVDAAFYNKLAQTSAVDEFTSDPVYLKLLDRETGQTLARSPNLAHERLTLNQPDFAAALAGRQVLSTGQDVNGLQVRILTFPLRDDTQQVLAVAQVHQSLQSIERVGTILIIVLVLGGLSAAILAFGVGYWLTRRQLRPLNELASTMYRLGAQGLDLRLDPGKTTAEIGLLTEAFNKMVGRLEASFALQRAFVADVSHELRTPLTSIRGQLDILLLNSKLKGEMRQDVQQVNTEVARLSRMVVNLLTSARAEAGMSPQLSARNLQPVELDGLLVEVAHQMRYTRQQVDLEITRLQQVKVAGDADLLKQLILNLLDNALTYTPAGGKVSLELTQSSFITEDGSPENDWVILNVADTGPGIDPADLPHIFERHYRARHTSSRSQVGAGLGLYIAGLIAQAHGGEITVQSELSKGTCFNVRLPVFTSGQLASQTEIGVAQMQQPPEEYIEQVDKQSARFSRFILFLMVFVLPLLIIVGLAIAIFFFSNELPK